MFILNQNKNIDINEGINEEIDNSSVNNNNYLKEIIDIGKSVIIAVIFALLIINFVFETVSVEGRSMFSTLDNKDRLIVEKVTYYFSKPKPGDIVVIKNPQNIKERFIKRVVAVAGDRVKIENNKLYINDKPKDEIYIHDNIMSDFEEVTVPKNYVFVLGDNRNNSKDSRMVGSIDLKLVVGKATIRLYPFDKIGGLYKNGN